MSDLGLLDTVFDAIASTAIFVALEAEARGVTNARDPRVIANLIATSVMPSSSDDDEKRNAIVALLAPRIAKNIAPESV